MVHTCAACVVWAAIKVVDILYCDNVTCDILVLKLVKNVLTTATKKWTTMSILERDTLMLLYPSRALLGASHL